MATHATTPWLPSSPFLAAGINSDLDCFPSEFPYEFGVPSPTVESVAGSTETESGDEEEDFFAALTRRLSQSSLHETRKQQQTTPPINAGNKPDHITPFSEIPAKARGFSGSPQSTLTGVGSWSGRSAFSGDGSPNGYSRVPSPSTTPFSDNNDPWEVIYAAAGQVARLKMNNNNVSELDFQNRGGLLCFSRSNTFSNQIQQKNRCDSVWGTEMKKQNWLVQNRAREISYDYESVKCTRPFSVPQSPFPRQRNPVRVTGSRVSLPVKRGCGGTGVFLPRHYENTPPSVPPKKNGCSVSPVLLPAKVVPTLNLNVDDPNSIRQPCFSNYDALIARRNAILLQQRLNFRREEAANYEVRLPQEWTY